MNIKINRVKHSKDPYKGGHVKIDVAGHVDAIRVYFTQDESIPAIGMAELICDIPTMIEMLKKPDEEQTRLFLIKHGLK